MPDERPPIFSKWEHWYLLLLIINGLVIGLFYLFMVNYSL